MALVGFSPSVLLELRAGEGGADARAFLLELARMYERFARRQGWEVARVLATPAGDPHRVVLAIEGAEAHKSLAAESGVVRVQRVPANDRSGRRHTSTVSVAVLPVEGRPTVEVRDADLVWQAQTSGGPGGQHVNKTQSAVRLTHKPTGISVLAREERSQHQNLAIAKARIAQVLTALAQEKAEAERRHATRSQIGRASRAEHRRTFDFCDGVVTDRITGRSSRKIKAILDGRLELLL